MKPEDLPFEATRAPEPPAPPLSALWTGGRAEWIRHHLTDRATGLGQVALFHLLGLTGPRSAAALGRVFGRLARRIDARRPYVTFMRRAIDHIRPDLDGGGREALLARWWEQAGTTHAQYAVLDRLARNLTIRGEERMRAIETASRPTFIVIVHLGNFEMFGHVWNRLSLSRGGFGLYEPQPNRFQNRLIHRQRRKRRLYVYPPSPLLPRTLIPFIENGCVGVFFVDEVSEERNKFPLWGRAVPARCNLVFMLKLAHRFGARLQPCHFLREAPDRVSFHALEPLEPDNTVPRERYLEDNARRLSAVFEPIVARHLDQWYMLKDVRI